MRYFKVLFGVIFSVCLLSILKSQVLYVPGGSGAVVQSPSYIGIGAPSPLALLNISYDSAVAAAIRLEDSSHADLAWTIGGRSASGRFGIFDSKNSVSRLSIDQIGRVGIGTDTPTDKLTVVGNASLYTESDGQAIKFIGRLSDGMSQLAFYLSDATTFAGLLQYHGDGTIVFVNTPSLVERMRISSDGKVGIGMSTPVRALTVGDPLSSEIVLHTSKQAADLRNYRIYSSNGFLCFGTLNDTGTAGVNQIVLDQKSGNITFGGTGPLNDYKLGVTGKIRADGLTLSVPQVTSEAVASGNPEELSVTEGFINDHGRLPGLPDRAELEASGLDVGQVTMQLMKKMADLTRHVIKLERRVQAQEEQIRRLEQLAVAQTVTKAP